MQYTANYNLKKPELTETADIQVINQNMDTLDTKIKEVETAANALPGANTITDDMIGTRTPDQTQAPASPGTGKIGQLVSWLANRIKAITGKTNWYDAPDITLATLASHKTRHATGGADALAPADIGAAAASDLAAHLADYVKQIPYGVATGSANAYAVTLSPAPTSYIEGMAIAVKINVDNTGASTINVNGLGAKAIKKPNGLDVAVGNLKANSVYTLRYNGVNFILQGERGSGTAQPADVLSGKTFTNDQDEQTGTMPNRGAVVITPSTTNQAIAAGYHNGSGYVKGDANLVAGNIRSGVSIFGVTGTVTPKYEASGTVSVTANSTSYSVSGLSFTPVLVIITHSWGTLTAFAAKGTLGGSNLPGDLNYWNYTAGFGPNGAANITFTTDGFTFTSASKHYSNLFPVTYTWRALG